MTVSQLEIPSATKTTNQLPPCLYCAGTGYRKLYDGITDRLGWVEGTWSYAACVACGSATLAPHPDASELASFYPPVYCFDLESEGQSRFEKMRKWCEYNAFFRPQYAAQTKRVLRGIDWDGQTGLKLLDVGCGRGLRLQAFQDRGFEVVGTDFVEESVRYVQSELGIEAAVCDIAGHRQHFQPDSFDVVTAFHLVEHLSNVHEFMEVMTSLLRPGGWLVIAVPLADAAQCRLFGSRWTAFTEAPRHVTVPSQAGLKAAYGQFGFEDISVSPDSPLACAAQVGLSLFPAGLNTHTQGRRRWWSLANRLLAGATTVASLPSAIVENRLLRQPAFGVAVGRKPMTSQSADGEMS